MLSSWLFTSALNDIPKKQSCVSTDAALLILSESFSAEARASLFFESHMSLELNLQPQLTHAKYSKLHAGQVFVDDDDDDDDDEDVDVDVMVVAMVIIILLLLLLVLVRLFFFLIVIHL